MGNLGARSRQAEPGPVCPVTIGVFSVSQKDARSADATPEDDGGRAVAHAIKSQ
jgi:hypothetical protein